MKKCLSMTMDWVLGRYHIQPSSFMVMVALICNIPRVLARSQQSLIESLWLWRSCDRLEPHRNNTSIYLVHDIESCNKLITYDGRGHDMTQNNNISDKDNEENMRVTIIFLLRLIFKNISQMLSNYCLRFIKIRETQSSVKSYHKHYAFSFRI